jgi:hypothetical protein
MVKSDIIYRPGVGLIEAGKSAKKQRGKAGAPKTRPAAKTPDTPQSGNLDEASLEEAMIELRRPGMTVKPTHIFGNPDIVRKLLAEYEAREEARRLKNVEHQRAYRQREKTKKCKVCDGTGSVAGGERGEVQERCTECLIERKVS